MSINLSLAVGSFVWTKRVLWGNFKFSFRSGVGATATFDIDSSGVTDLIPTCEDRFNLTFPTGEKVVLVPVGDPETKVYGTDGIDLVTVHSYETIDVVTALDRIPLPTMQFIESTAGEIITNLVAAMDSTLDTSGVTTGNDVPFLDTKDFVKFSDILKHASIATGGYVAQIDPFVNNGLAIKADYKTNWGDSGITVDKDSHDFTPAKEVIVPDNQMVNSQRVKSTKPGPHHTVCEFRELDALDSSFKLKTLPYGLDGTELINFQFDSGLITDAANDDATTIANGGNSALPNVVPMHYPVQVEVADITLDGSGVVCGFVGRGGSTVLGVSVAPTAIGAVVGGSTIIESVPFAPSAHAPDIDHQFFYDFYALFTTSGLHVSIVENYLDNTAATTPLATITSINRDTGEVGITLVGLDNISQLPESIRFISAGDPTDVRGFGTIKSRSGSTIIVDNIPLAADLDVGDQIANGDSAITIVTEKVIYDGAAPSNRYAKPQFIISGGSGVRARQWTASYGPAIEAVLLDNAYTGAPGRKLRVDTVASRSTDMVVSKSGNTAICTFVGERLPLRGDIQLILNYDAAKIVDVTVTDDAGIARCGIRQGDLITSDAVLTAAEATALAQAVLDEFSTPKPKGTITRESILTASLPVPNQLVAIDLPPEYKIEATSVEISELSVDFGGYDSDADEGVLIYHITLGNIDAQDAVKRQLLANQTSIGLEFRPLSASGARISSASWNDTNLVTLGISGSITIAGQPASTSFDPINYISGNFREAPVRLAGTTLADSTTGELFVEIIYPPLDINPTSETCTYSARTNEITYRWGHAAGAQEYDIKRLVDDGTNTGHLVYKQIDKIFTEQYPLPYEPDSKSIQILTIGLADKQGAGGYITVACTLPALPAPTPFDLAPGKVVKPNGRVALLIGAPPTGEFLHRAELVRILLTKSPTVTPPTTRAHFSASDSNLVTGEFKVEGVTTSTRQVLFYTESDPGESIWATACWVDKFGQEGEIAEPFDLLHPPVTVGSISTSDFFQSAPQSSGGTVEDDDEQTAQIEFSGVFRVHLGNHNQALKIWFEESDPFRTGGTVNWSNIQFTSHGYDITDDDVVNGYADIPVKRRFLFTKKKWRKYRPTSITFIGPAVRSRPDASGNSHGTPEKKFLVGYTGSAPALNPHDVDGVFDKSTFEFQPGIAGLGNNFTNVNTPVVIQLAKGFKVRFDTIDEAGVRRYVVFVSTTQFGTNGPGTDTNIATDLNTLFNTGASTGSITLYNSGNTARNVSAQVIDIADSGVHLFHNGDVVGALTIASNTTYYVGVLAQSSSGRWSSAISTVVSTASGPVDTVNPPPAPPTPVLGDIVENSINPASGDGTALVTFVVWADATHTKAFSDPTINASEAYIFLRSGDSADKIPLGGAIASPGSTSCRISENLKSGVSYTIAYAMLGNGGGYTKSSLANISFTAGVTSLANPTVTLTLSAINYHHSNARVQIAQPTTVKPVKLIRLYQNGGTNPVDHINVINDPAFNTANSTGTFDFRVKHPGNVAQTFQVELIFPGGSNLLSSIQSITPGVDPPNDSGIPSAPPAPTLTEYIGSVLVNGILPGTNANTRLNWQFAICDVNVSPTNADPPLAGGGAVFKYKENPGSTVKFTVPGLATGTVRYFFCRCKNASNTTGGVGGQGWSNWSTSSNVNGTQSVITAVTGTGAPSFPTVTDSLAAAGYSSVSNVNSGIPISPTTKEAVRCWFNADDNTIVLEFILPTDQNAFSLSGIFAEQYKASNGVLRNSVAINPSLTSVIKFPAFSTALSAIRFRLQNNYRDTSGTSSGNGYSAWSNYVKGDSISSGGAGSYNPGTNPPPAPDFHSIGSRPDVYSGLL